MFTRILPKRRRSSAELYDGVTCQTIALLIVLSVGTSNSAPAFGHY
jgi:hypothetical protein